MADHPPPWAKDYCPVCHTKWAYFGCEPGNCGAHRCPACRTVLGPGAVVDSAFAVASEMEAILRRLVPFSREMAALAHGDRGCVEPEQFKMLDRSEALIAALDAARKAGG